MIDYSVVAFLIHLLYVSFFFPFCIWTALETAKKGKKLFASLGTLFCFHDF